MTTPLAPDQLTPDERSREIAAILATAIRRLRQPVIPTPSAPQKLPNSEANELAVRGEKSVTVHAG